MKPIQPNVQTFIGCDTAYVVADTVIFGAPFDSTTSFRPGARFGPAAIRSESFGIETYSPYQEADLEDAAALDVGDLELPFGSAARALAEIEAFVADLLMDKKQPCMMGGEHLVTLGAVRALAASFPDLRVVHFDAHADLREEYMGEKFSHATVIRRVWDLLGDGRIWQFGIRSGCRQEFDWSRTHVRREMFTALDTDAAVREIGDAPVYITVDLDVLDPSEFSGTGTPEAGGLAFTELLGALLGLRCLNVVGFDLCELSPHYDTSGASTAVACKTLREMLLAFAQV